MRISDWSSDVCSSDLLDAGRPLLDSISDLMGYWSFFENFIQIACLLFAWALVILAFFILAIQLFVTLIEFKLTTLAGFVLIPFGLFGKTAFMAELVLDRGGQRSEEHTSELQSLMRISYAVFCLKKKTQNNTYDTNKHT